MLTDVGNTIIIIKINFTIIVIHLLELLGDIWTRFHLFVDT